MLRAAQLEVSDLVCRNHDLAALVIRQDKDGAIGNCGSQGALDLLKGGFGVHDKFSWHGLNSDLDFHGTPLAPRPESWSKYAGPAASADQGFRRVGPAGGEPDQPCAEANSRRGGVLPRGRVPGAGRWRARAGFVSWWAARRRCRARRAGREAARRPPWVSRDRC